jgi:hypothetical protein
MCRRQAAERRIQQTGRNITDDCHRINLLTALIDALEERAVACFDIPGAFVHAETDKDVIMMLKGRLAELMVMVEPSLYRKYVTTDSKGEPILFVQMHKALY